MSYRAWIRTCAQFIAAKPLVCPECGEAEISVRFVGYLDSRLGYAVLWCPKRLRGVHISRLEVPSGFDMIAIDDIERIQAEVANIQLVE
jgi:hypothetical protein